LETVEKGSIAVWELRPVQFLRGHTELLGHAPLDRSDSPFTTDAFQHRERDAASPAAHNRASRRQHSSFRITDAAPAARAQGKRALAHHLPSALDYRLGVCVVCLGHGAFFLEIPLRSAPHWPGRSGGFVRRICVEADERDLRIARAGSRAGTAQRGAAQRKTDGPALSTHHALAAGLP